MPGDKIPLAPHGSNDATQDEEQIRQWWERWPDANVGYSLDKTGLVDVSSDCPEWADTFAARGLPETLSYSSGGGEGHQHNLYRLPVGGPVARICVPGQYDIMSQGNVVAPGSIHPSGRAYELQSELLPVEDLPFAPAWVVAMLQEHVQAERKEPTPEEWDDLPIGALGAHTRRFQALLKAKPNLRAVCAGEAITIRTKHGAQDDSTSIQRYVFVCELLHAHYPHNEIRALAKHFQGVLESPDKDYEADIDRLLFKYTPKDYKSQPTGIVAQAPTGGRHYEITAGELRDAYFMHADCGINGIVLEWSVSEAATRLGVSTGTIKRREAELVAAGEIAREYGRVILSPDTWENRSQRIETRQTDNDAIGSQRSIVPQNGDDTANRVTDNEYQSTETVYKNTIGSQFDMPQQDAPNAPLENVRNERAHVEITHSPGLPNRDLVTFVRDLAAAAAEPGWFLRDYAGWSKRALQAEADRLGALLDATDDGEALHADIAAEHWKRTTWEGRQFARREGQQRRDMANIERLQPVLRGPPGRLGECVPSIRTRVQQVML